MFKSLKTLKKNFRPKFRFLKTVQDSIPITRVHPSGIWQVDENKYSICLLISDTNYAVLSDYNKEQFLQKYWTFLNGLDSGAVTKITICNRYMKNSDIDGKMVELLGDELDPYRDDFNQVIQEKAFSGSRIRKERYITITTVRDSLEKAQAYFSRVTTEFSHRLQDLGVKMDVLRNEKRFDLLRAVYQSEENPRQYDLKDCLQHGDFKAMFAPNTLQFKSDYFITDGKKYGRVSYIKDFPAYLKDSFIAESTNVKNPLMLSMDFSPVSTQESLDSLNKILLGIETNIAKFTQRQNQNNNYNTFIPKDLEMARDATREMIDDVTNNDQRILFGHILVLQLADSLEQLNQDTDELKSNISAVCNLSILKNEQEKALNTVLPIGAMHVFKQRTFLTESASALQPFNVQDMDDDGGQYYGANPISNNLIFVDRKKLTNGNMILLGTSGGGKSFIAKREIYQVALGTDDEILILDPEREYGTLVRNLGGEVINISATSKNHINALDITSELAEDENIIKLKSEFILSLCEHLTGQRLLASEQSIIDRCIQNVYADYLKNKAFENPPTLKEFHTELMRQSEPEARQIALSLELFTKGSLNVFAHPTNVNTDNRIVCFDILDLGQALKTVGMLVVLDAIQNRISQNRTKGIRTWIYADEVYLLLSHEQSGAYLFQLWKRLRKYGGLATAITQNIKDMLHNPQAEALLANSAMKILCKQASEDSSALQEFLHLNDAEMSYVRSASVGKGAMIIENDFIPFEDMWDTNSLGYKMMSTKPNES